MRVRIATPVWAVAAIVVLMAAGCSLGPNRARVINQTTVPIAIRADYNGRTVLTVPACSTVRFQSDGAWHAVEPPASATTTPADPAAVFVNVDMPYGAEGGAGGDILVTADRVTVGPPGWFTSPPPCAGRPIPASPTPPLSRPPTGSDSPSQ